MTRCSRGLKNIIKGLLGKASHGHAFEELGNYVYTISPRELEKVALGIGLPAVAFAGVNDYYLPGVELEPAQESSALFRRVRARIAHYDRLCRLGINQWGLLGALMLKDNPNEALRSALQRHGYELTVLPANPYLKGRPR